MTTISIASAPFVPSGVRAGGGRPAVTRIPRVTSKGPGVRAEIKLPLADIAKDPVEAASSLVGELMFGLRPDLAPTAALRAQLQKRIEADRGTNIRFVGFREGKV